MAITYDSSTDLNLGQVPDVGDPILYRALLDIHNALENLVKGSDDIGNDFADFLKRYLKITAIGEDYLAVPADNTILVDATAGDITVTLPDAATTIGYPFTVKRIDTVRANKVTVVVEAGQLIDGRTNGINISSYSSYTFKSIETGYIII